MFSSSPSGLWRKCTQRTIVRNASLPLWEEPIAGVGSKRVNQNIEIDICKRNWITILFEHSKMHRIYIYKISNIERKSRLRSKYNVFFTRVQQRIFLALVQTSCSSQIAFTYPIYWHVPLCFKDRKVMSNTESVYCLVHLKMTCQIGKTRYICKCLQVTSLIARFMGPTLGPSGADRTQMGPMLAP